MKRKENLKYDQISRGKKYKKYSRQIYIYGKHIWQPGEIGGEGRPAPERIINGKMWIKRGKCEELRNDGPGTAVERIYKYIYI